MTLAVSCVPATVLRKRPFTQSCVRTTRSPVAVARTASRRFLPERRHEALAVTFRGIAARWAGRGAEAPAGTGVLTLPGAAAG